MNKSIVDEYVDILQYYLEYYGLYNIDLKNLLNTSTDIVQDIKKGKNGPTLKKLGDIAQLFGLNYYEFGNPELKLLEKEDLPTLTQEKILWRAEVGPPESKKYNKLDLNNSVIDALTAFKDTEKILASEVYDSLPQELKEKLGSAIRITGLFSDELGENVEKTGEKLEKGDVGRKQEYYKVISLEKGLKRKK
ncbi:MAG TPA: hypothetical protein DCG77_15305 [Sphingobacterium sp.]|nr:hypothetical protein [Sphingobacterium sp.]